MNARHSSHSPELQPYLQPTWFLDCDAPAVVAFAERALDGARNDRDRAARLFYAVRDGIRYDPYSVAGEREAYRASEIATRPRGFCIQKAILLAAAARSAGIPSRLRFADVRNHLTSRKLRALMGTDVFVFHGYDELFVDGQWLKVTPTFNRELCERFGVKPLEFDGTADAIFHPFDAQNRRHMEYVRDRGSFADLPYDEMIEVFRRAYPELATAVQRAAVEDSRFRPDP